MHHPQRTRCTVKTLAVIVALAGARACEGEGTKSDRPADDRAVDPKLVVRSARRLGR
ncbi:hypothetical protein ABZU25_01490 [Micromonospora sp. NPDC005215]|uniref:hypothetical protein n=1 Tax=Micromonospora sp. NPDC005215 TaxID=3157024 RepID=UPI0033BAF661